MFAVLKILSRVLGAIIGVYTKKNLSSAAIHRGLFTVYEPKVVSGNPSVNFLDKFICDHREPRTTLFIMDIWLATLRKKSSPFPNNAFIHTTNVCQHTPPSCQDILWQQSFGEAIEI